MHLVAGMGNAYIDLGHAMAFQDAQIIAMTLCQMIQYVVYTLIIALKDVSYSVRFCLILQSMYPWQYSTNIASTALPQYIVLHDQSFLVYLKQILCFKCQTVTF